MSEISLTIDFKTGLASIAILLLLNSVLAMAETALLSARRARLQNLSNQGEPHTGSILKLDKKQTALPLGYFHRWYVSPLPPLSWAFIVWNSETVITDDRINHRVLR
ncbi:MAG: DUF21 domain-containing protein [Chloroflexi bacterium]|nr:DUF21 domain-containing protein [Chloroflexota bacterium]